MSLRRSTRMAFHLLLAAALVIPGIVAPAQAITEGFQAATAPSDANDMTMANMPCDDADMPVATDTSAPCDCCGPHACDFSACLGTACLPELPRITAMVPPAAAPLPWQPPALALAVIDTPLRPPIV